MKQIALALCALSLSAHAQFYTGNDLLDRIRSNRPFAMGFISGVADGTANAYGGHCIPPQSVTLGQITDMVEMKLVNTPELRHLPAAAYVFSVLQTAWPCPVKKGTPL